MTDTIDDVAAEAAAEQPTARAFVSRAWPSS
jgi:hypothetical protein